MYMLLNPTPGRVYGAKNTPSLTQINPIKHFKTTKSRGFITTAHCENQIHPQDPQDRSLSATET